MCWSIGMSVLLGTLSFAVAAHEYKCFKSLHYSLGIAYWGVMEFLQAVQHVYAAVPEDNYAMCNNWINNKLTDWGAVHIVFQPLFVSMCLMSMYRRHDLQARIEADLVWKLCIFAGLWYASHGWISALMGVDQELLPPATEDCPNYMWLNEGYDGFLKDTTPNIPGKPCTYYAPTRSGHLAWAIPIYKQQYMFPSGNLHFFLFFAPYFVMFNRPFLQCVAIVAWLLGPILSRKITPSVNEQPAIWCVYSIVQAIIFAVVVRWKELHKQPAPARIRHEGAYGEKPLTYVLCPEPESSPRSMTKSLLPGHKIGVSPKSGNNGDTGIFGIPKNTIMSLVRRSGGSARKTSF